MSTSPARGPPVWPIPLAVTVGMACSFYPSAVVIEALLITAAVVVGLTLYTFHATRRGVDFGCALGPGGGCGGPCASPCLPCTQPAHAPGMAAA